MIIKQATINDIPEILNLLKENHLLYIKDKTDGFITIDLTEKQLKNLIEKENGATIAIDKEHVVAFALAASWSFWSEWAFFVYMQEQLNKFSFNDIQVTVKNSYQYGPVCVDKNYRRTGLFEKIFFKSLKNMQKRYSIMVTFINKINKRSYIAHTKKGKMKAIGSFRFNDNDYYLMACNTYIE